MKKLSIIDSKYYEIRKLFEKMTQSSPDERPNCEEILKNRHLWALDENEFEFENEMNVILKSKENNEMNFVHLMLEFKFIAMKTKLKKIVIDSNLIEEEVLHISKILNIYQHRPKLVENSLKYLCQIILKSTGYKFKLGLIELLVDLIIKFSDSVEIQSIGIGCIALLTQKGFEIEELNINILNKLHDAVLTSLELFPNNKNIFSNAMNIFVNIKSIKYASFNRFKCLQFIMQMLINNESDENSSFSYSSRNFCSCFAKQILHNEKLNLSSKSTFVKTILQIIRSSILYKMNYRNLLDYCLTTILELAIESNENKKLLIEEEVLDLVFLVLKVSFSILDLIYFNFNLISCSRNLKITEILSDLF
jgi:hypothetical protein